MAIPAALAAPPGSTRSSERAAYELLFRRVEGRHASGDPLWLLDLTRNGRPLARWRAASGLPERQSADRRWSPGNGAPLPAGLYDLGRPQPWNGSYWMDLRPRFPTSRTALGIHTCLPGSGCICLPSLQDTRAVARWISRLGLRTLRVVN